MTTSATLTAVDPSSGEVLGQYPETRPEDVAAIVATALAAAQDPALADPVKRAAALRGAAAAIRAAGDELRATFQAESGLPAGRATGELERTCVQLELFADVVDRGDHLEAIIDPPDPDFKPLPRPDLRRMLVPIGPVVVFGASNFPFAFGVGGGDLAAAIAAGCPVIAKGHPSQPGVNALVGDAITAAFAEAGLPEGTFTNVQGADLALSQALVDADGIAAVGFTGSQQAGRALFDRAAARSRPIPVYAEMGSTNPAVVTRAALDARADAIRDGLVTAITGAGGQLCTKPGVVFLPDGPAGDAFATAFAAALDDAPAAVMLNERLRDGFAGRVRELDGEAGVELLTDAAPSSEPGFRHRPVALSVDAATVARRDDVREEAFGPAVLFARYAGDEDLLDGLAAFDGQLAAAVFAEAADGPLVERLAAVLTARVGRLVFDAYPTGVAVTWAMQHGGPYPASSTPDHTSVGMTASRRFMRPVCWQDAPEHVLPAPLRDANPTGIWRRVDGRLSDGPV